MKAPTVICVLRSGGDYTPEHVQALHTAVARYWPQTVPLRFVALTDTPIGCAAIEERTLEDDQLGWWAKLELFYARQDDLGDLLYFDLDTMITGRLDDIVATRSLTLLRDFYYPERVQSGMMYLPMKDRPEIMAALLDEYHCGFPGDGEFLDALWRARAHRWQDEVPDQIASYKVDIRQRRGQSLPPHTRVVCFHGRPRPWATALWTRYREHGMTS